MILDTGHWRLDQASSIKHPASSIQYQFVQMHKYLLLCPSFPNENVQAIAE